MKRAFFPAFLAVLVFTLSFIACDSVFNKSWGEFREYKEENIKVNTDNIDDWVKRSIGNPDLAAAVGRAIDKLFNDDDFELTDDNVKLLSGRVRLLTKSVDMSTSLLSNASDKLGDLLDGDVDGKAFGDIFKGMQDDFEKANGKEAAEDLAALLAKPAFIDGIDTGTPTFKKEYSKTVTSEEVVEIMLVLIMAEMDDDITIDENTSIDNIVKGLEPDGKGVKTNTSSTDNEILLAAYCNLLMSDDFKADDPISNAIKDLISSN